MYDPPAGGPLLHGNVLGSLSTQQSWQPIPLLALSFRQGSQVRTVFRARKVDHDFEFMIRGRRLGLDRRLRCVPSVEGLPG